MELCSILADCNIRVGLNNAVVGSSVNIFNVEHLNNGELSPAKHLFEQVDVPV